MPHQRRLRRALRLSLAALVPLAAASAARAEGLMVPIDQVAAGSIKMNGVLTEWTAGLTPLSRKVSGNPGSGSDLTVRAGLAYDDDALYLAADIIDDKLVRTAAYAPSEDHLSLTLGFPEGAGFTTVELDLFQGDPGNIGGAVLFHAGGKVAGAQLVEAPNANKTGLTVEARIPWASLAPAAKVRVGLRGAIRYTDNDGRGIEGVVGTAGEQPTARLPRLPIDAERAIDEVLVKEKSLQGAPQFDIVADVAGDDLKERIVLWDQYLVVVGPHFKDGKSFFFSDLGVDKGMISGFEVRDVTGDGKGDFVIRKRRGSAQKWREILEVDSLADSGLVPLFVHEVGIQTESGVVANTVKIDGKEIEIGPGTSTGLSPATFKDPVETGFDAALLPWGAIRGQTYRYNGSKFEKVKEDLRAAADGAGPGGAAPRPRAQAEPPAPPAPRPPTADELQDQVLALYKRDRKVAPSERPRFDLVTNVAEDSRVERVVVFGKDLVIFGKGFLGGTSYVTMGLGFADPRDVLDVTTRDLNGDGRAEILVRGVQRIAAPKELGTGKIERELLLVYSVQDGKIARVFAAETGVSLGDKRITATLGFLPAARGLELSLGPGHAVGWDIKSFPFRQESQAQGGIEPLLLPWTDAPVRYQWSGAGFTR